jgi:hypothetical protein
MSPTTTDKTLSQKVNAEALKVAKQLEDDPQRFIVELFDIERVIIGIVGSSQNPMSIGHIRKAFISEIQKNLDWNLWLTKELWFDDKTAIKLLVAKIGKLESTMIHGSKTRPEQILNEEFDKTDKALREEGKEGLTSSKIKLIPNYEFFQKVVEEFLVTKGIFKYRPSVYENAKFVYYLNPEIYDMWDKNRKELLAIIEKNPDKDFKIQELSFYYLTHELLSHRLNDARKNKRKYPDPTKGLYPICLTETEERFLNAQYNQILLHFLPQ